MSRTSVFGWASLLVVAAGAITVVASGCARKEFVAGPWMQVWPPPDDEMRASNPVSYPMNNASQAGESGEATAQNAATSVQPKPEAKSGDGLDASSPSDGRGSVATPEAVDVAKDQRLSATQREFLTHQIAAIHSNLRGTGNGSPSEATGHTEVSESGRGQRTAAQPNASRSHQITDSSDRPGQGLLTVAQPNASCPPEVTDQSPPSLSPRQLANNSVDARSGGDNNTNEPRPQRATSETFSSADRATSADAHGVKSNQATEHPESRYSSDGQSLRTEAGRWRGDLQQAIENLRRELGEASSMSDAERGRLEATLRLLYVIGEQRDDCVREITVLDGESREFWKLTAAGLYELLDRKGSPVPDRRNKLALRYLREAVQHLAAASSLDVRNLAICRRVESFGQYTEFEPYEFKAEQEVILYVEVANFAAEQKAEGYETEFQGSYQILDTSGRRIADYDLPLDKQTCRNLRTDYFLPYRIFLPKSLPAGSYQIQVTIEDKKGKKFGQSPPVMFSIRS